MIVLISGYKKSGKKTMAKTLVSELGYTQTDLKSLESLKDKINVLDDYVVADFKTPEQYDEVKSMFESRNIPVVTVRINRYGVTPAKDPKDRKLDGFSHDLIIENRNELSSFKKYVVQAMLNAGLQYDISSWT